MTRIWAIANQKGGVGKTTTTLALGAELAMRGWNVLLMDLDPHASLTRAFGLPAEPQPRGVLELFEQEQAPLQALVRPSEMPRLSFVAAQSGLATLERRSASQPGLGRAIATALACHGDAFDHVLLDCSPTLGLLMVNALAAADHLVIPTQTEPLALHGLQGMWRTAQMIGRSRGRALPVSILPTLFDRRTRVGIDTLASMQEQYGENVWSDAIPNDTRMCGAEELIRQGSQRLQSGRALKAYRRALDWLVSEQWVDEPAEEALA
jgi:chromosome partitioning protein